MFNCEITGRFSEVTKAFARRELEAGRHVAPEKTMLKFEEFIEQSDYFASYTVPYRCTANEFKEALLRAAAILWPTEQETPVEDDAKF